MSKTPGRGGSYLRTDDDHFICVREPTDTEEAIEPEHESAEPATPDSEPDIETNDDED